VSFLKRQMTRNRRKLHQPDKENNAYWSNTECFPPELGKEMSTLTTPTKHFTVNPTQ
jgi:hypothetical protein